MALVHGQRLQFLQVGDCNAALLTGRLPIRFGLAASKSGGQGVFSCTAKTGLPEDEVTLADLLKGHGYRTHMVGCAPVALRFDLLF